MAQRRTWLTTRDTPALLHMADLAGTLGRSVHTVAQSPVSEGPARDAVDRDLSDLDASASASLMAFLTALRSAYVTPLPREDLYLVASGIHHAVQRVVAAGILVHHGHMDELPADALDMLETIGRQSELLTDATGQLRDLDALEETWIQLTRASRRTDRVLVQWLASLGEDLLQREFNRQREVAWALQSAIEALREVNTHLGAILVRES